MSSFSLCTQSTTDLTTENSIVHYFCATVCSSGGSWEDYRLIVRSSYKSIVMSGHVYHTAARGGGWNTHANGNTTIIVIGE